MRLFEIQTQRAVHVGRLLLTFDINFCLNRRGQEEVDKEYYRNNAEHYGYIPFGFDGFCARFSFDCRILDKIDDVANNVDNAVRHDTHTDTVGYGVCERHKDYSKKRGDRVAQVVEVDILDVGHHKNADIDESARRRRRRYEREYG